MQALRIPLRVVLYRQEDSWVAHCLEFDLCGDGESRKEALDSLSEAVGIQLVESVAHGNPKNLFCPADGELFRKFAAGKDIAHGQMELHIAPVDSVVIEGAEYREYSDDPNGDKSGCGELVTN